MIRRIALTRAQDDAEATAAELAARGYEAVIAPAIEIRALIDDKELPPLRPSGGGPGVADVQQVLKPDTGRTGTLPEGSPSPA